MGKPYIIIADTDENYIVPLEMKFLEELGDDVDLEIITDARYFRKLFSGPQEADILAVSQELFTEDLLRHSISNMFILGELSENESGFLKDIPYVYKYSSLKEIYGKIMACSSESLSLDMSHRKKQEVLLVSSASGGVGKTTIALGVCTALSQNFKRVLYINADRLNSFQFYLENTEPVPVSACRDMDGRGDIYERFKCLIRRERFDYLPPFGAALSSLNIPYSFYTDFARGAKSSGDYDVIVVDSDSVFDNDKAAMASEADKVFMITDQTRKAVFAMKLLMQNMNCRDNEKYYFICNKYQKDKPDAFSDEGREPGFLVDEYVSEIEQIDELCLADLGMNMDIQKISFLIDQ